MEIVAAASDWLYTDAENLRTFLSSSTGQRLLPKLAEKTPGLLPGGDINAILIRSGEVKGIQLILQEILALTSPEQEPIKVISQHPPLEDDAAWDDGKKLNDPNATLE